MKNTSSKTAIILVDMQDFFLKNFKKNVRSKLVDNQLKVLERCKKEKIPLIVLEYKTRGIYRGKTTPALSEKIKSIYHNTIIKENNSGFTNTDLGKTLDDLKIKKLFIMGINANACVQDTAISALKRGYRVIVSKETMACAWRDGGEMSKKNEEWYKENCTLLETAKEAISEIS
jgi:nicotinamidase-related amidase